MSQVVDSEALGKSRALNGGRPYSAPEVLQPDWFAQRRREHQRIDGWIGKRFKLMLQLRLHRSGKASRVSERHSSSPNTCGPLRAGETSCAQLCIVHG
jgi:hypothetical protein